MTLNMTLEKKIHKWRKKLGRKKTDLSRCETAGVTIGRSASLASFFSTHRWGKNGEQKQERKAFHFSVNVWKLLGETKYRYKKVSLSFSQLPRTEKKSLFHFSSFSKLRISCCLSPCLSKNVLLSLREYTYTSFDWIASYLCRLLCNIMLCLLSDDLGHRIRLTYSNPEIQKSSWN